MYNHDYYATLDQAMVKQLKYTALNILRTLIAIALCLFLQPVRLYEYIEDCSGWSVTVRRKRRFASRI